MDMEVLACFRPGFLARADKQAFAQNQWLRNAGLSEDDLDLIKVHDSVW